VGVAHEVALLIEQELTDAETLDQWQERLEKAAALESESWIAASDADRERFRAFRHSLPETVNARVRRNGFLKLGSDYAVPFECNREMLSCYRQCLESSFLGKYVIYGHIGDGHVHVNILPETKQEFDRAQELMVDFAEKAVSLGGTVGAEHGLGKRKAHLLKLMYSPSELRAMEEVKTRLDPHWLLGPGTLFEAR